MILDCFRAGAAAPGYSVLEERENLARIEVTFAALPFGRSDVRETVWFPTDNQVVGGPPAPVYRPWEEIDRYGPANTDVHSVVQTASWGRAARPGGSGPYDGSAHWNPLAGANTPVYHRVLPAFRDITGRQQISLWAGLGNSNGQWRSGNLTFRVTLYDAGQSWVQFGGTFKLTASDNWNAPTFTRIAMAIPTGTGFHFEQLAEYVVEVPNFTTSARMGDLYLNCLGASPSAVAWTPPSVRGTVYSIALAGSARAPVSLRFQPPAGSFSKTEEWVNPGGLDFHVPAAGVTAPDGTPDAVQARVWSSAGACGSLTPTFIGLAGGGAGGNCAGDDHYPAPPNAHILGSVGQGAGGAATLPRPAAGQPSNLGTLTANGGLSGLTNDWHGASPGPATAAPIHWLGGWGGYARDKGKPNQGAGGGGGGAGSSGPGKEPPGQPGGEGGPGGGHGGGGHGPFDTGTGSGGGGPAGGGGGATRTGTGGTSVGARGANGRVQVTYLTSVLPMRTLLAHMPGPETHATFAPVIGVGDGNDAPDGGGPPSLPLWPDGVRNYRAVSPQEGMPVRYDGTYSGVLVAKSWASANLSRDITVRITQHDAPGGPTTTTVIGGGVFSGLVPQNDAGVMAGFLRLGTVTLPLAWLPPDNQAAYYTVTVDSRWHQGEPNAGQVTGDRFEDLLLLDVTGQTALLTHPTGYTNYFIDEPDTTQGLGGLLGSSFGRTQARSVTDSIVSLAGGPFILEPGQGNLLLAYSADRGSPSLGLDYWARWWFDRADDLAAHGVGGAPLPRGLPPPAALLAPETS